MREDPFYALSEIFDFYAASEMHFLNAIERFVRSSPERFQETLQQPLIDAHDNLHFFMRLLDEHIKTIAETNNFVKNRYCLRWLRSNENKTLRTALRIENDIQALLARANQLRDRCSSGMNNIMNQLKSAEAKEAMKQGKHTFKLTLLTAIFLPVIATATIFGMNFVQLPSISEGVWVWILVTTPLMVASFAMIRWDWDNGLSQRAWRSHKTS